MIRDLNNGKSLCGVFGLAANTVKTVDVPDDAKGVKIYSDDCSYYYGINEDPQIGSNALGKGAFGILGIIEQRILQDGVKRTLKFKSQTGGSVLVEFWG